MTIATVRSSKKIFTEEEVSNLTGICLEHLRNFARSKHLGFLSGATKLAGEAERWLFTQSDLMVMAALHPRCEH
jgi:hypothetical protein